MGGGGGVIVDFVIMIAIAVDNNISTSAFCH